VADEQVDEVDPPVDEVEARYAEANAESAAHEPWNFTLADYLCIGGIVLTIVRAWVSLLFVASLLGTHPVWLELIRGSSSSMVTAGAFASQGKASLTLAIIAGTIGLGILDVFYWWGGRRYGNRLLAFYTQRNKRYEKWVVRSEKFLSRWGGVALIVQYFQPIPNVLIYIGTGASGLPLWMWFVCNTLGCLLWTGLMVGLGFAIGTPVIHVAKTVSHYSLISTLAIVAVVVVFSTVRAVRDERAKAR
jgi:membrane-associated protein